MVTGLFGACGLWLGKTFPGGKDNAKGFFENILLREKAQKAILSAAGFDPLGVRKLPPPGWHVDIPDFRSGVAELLAAQGYDGAAPWGFKDAKMTLTWRIWHRHFPGAAWIIVHRPAEDVIASCLRTGFMNQHSREQGFWRDFVEAYQMRLDQLKSTVSRCLVVESAAVVGGRFEAIKEAVESVGLRWQDEAVRGFVTTELWHGGAGSPAAP
jgi:hypothetical protein